MIEYNHFLTMIQESNHSNNIEISNTLKDLKLIQSNIKSKDFLSSLSDHISNKYDGSSDFSISFEYTINKLNLLIEFDVEDFEIDEDSLSVGFTNSDNSETFYVDVSDNIDDTKVRNLEKSILKYILDTVNYNYIKNIVSDIDSRIIRDK